MAKVKSVASDENYGARANNGAQMATFFENPMFQEAMSQVYANLFKAWCETPYGLEGEEEREELHRVYRSAKTLDLVFKAYIKDGEQALATMKALTGANNKTEGSIYA